MTEKKATATTRKAAPRKAAVRKTTTKAAKAEVLLDATNVGYKAGDVYQALAAAGKPQSVAEIAKAAKINDEEVYLGIGWLFKEGKIKDEDGKVTLA